MNKISLSFCLILIACLVLVLGSHQAYATNDFQRIQIGTKDSIRVEQLVYKSGNLRVRGRLYLPKLQPHCLW